MSHPQPAQKTGVEVGKYFERAAEVFDTFYDEQRTPFVRWVDRHFRSDIYVRFDRTFANILPLEGKTVLDVGCGSGPYAVECATRGARRVVGLDLAGNMIDLARRRATRSSLDHVCTFIQGEFPKNAPEETFDYSIAMGVMDYIADKPAFLRAMAQRTNIRAVLSFPSYHWFRGPTRIVRYKMKQCPLWLYREREIRDLMHSAGFRDVEVGKIPGAGMDFVAVGGF